MCVLCGEVQSHDSRVVRQGREQSTVGVQKYGYRETMIAGHPAERRTVHRSREDTLGEGHLTVKGAFDVGLDEVGSDLVARVEAGE